MACLWAALVARLQADSDGTHPTLLCQGVFRPIPGEAAELIMCVCTLLTRSTLGDHGSTGTFEPAP